MATMLIQILFLGVLFCTATAITFTSRSNNLGVNDNEELNTLIFGEEDVGNANEYVDIVLQNLRNEPEVVKHLDPLSVPDIHEDKYSLKNMRVRGLSNLFRDGDCSLSYGDDNTVNVVAQVAVRGVTVTMDYSAKALFFWIHGDGVVAVDHLAVRLDLSSTDGNARLNSFKVVNLGNYYVKEIRGATVLLNWLVKIFANKAAQGARGDIIRALENGAKDALNDVLRQHKLPIY